MVPWERLISNLSDASPSKLNNNKSALLYEFRNLFTPDSSSELFEKLAEWNEILEKQAHHFK